MIYDCLDFVFAFAFFVADFLSTLGSTLMRTSFRLISWAAWWLAGNWPGVVILGALALARWVRKDMETRAGGASVSESSSWRVCDADESP